MFRRRCSASTSRTTPIRSASKDLLVKADDGSIYSKAHEDYHPIFRRFLVEGGYYDVFLFDTEGNLVYTVFKELDYATNLNTGEYRDTDLGEAFRAGLQAASAEDISYFDFRPYAPSAGAPASFMSAPIMEDGAPAGVLVFQMPIDRFNAVMSDDTGLGETGEALLVGEDRLVRNDTRFTDGAILDRRIDTDAVAAALAGRRGVDQTDGKITAFEPFTIMGVNYALLATKDSSEALAAVQEATIVMSALVSVVVVVFLFVGLFMGRQVSRPISELTEEMGKLADGDLKIDILHPERGDEIGDMAKAMEVFRRRAIENEELRAKQAEQEAEIKAQQQRAKELQEASLKEMADTVEAESGRAVGEVSRRAQEMADMADQMTAAVQQVQTDSAAVSAAAEQALANAEAVAGAAEELSASISEISGQVAGATQIADRASKEANDTRTVVNSLSTSAGQIGEVVHLISDIAEQTNLLALNATIEAAAPARRARASRSSPRR
jgi:methyl-accepting chemotaxis protein